MDFTRKSQKCYKKTHAKIILLGGTLQKYQKIFLSVNFESKTHNFKKNIFFVSRAKRFGKIYAIREKMEIPGSSIFG